jgi:hypothetical protein
MNLDGLRDSDADLLPTILREMADLIGLPATLTLVRHYGGTRLWVPLTMKPDHVLARLLGFDTAALLARHYGDTRQHFDIPRAAEALRALRNRHIRAQKALGKSRRELAREHALTERAIDYITGDDGEADAQGGLFS